MRAEVAAARELPEYPADCRRAILLGVQLGEPLAKSLDRARLRVNAGNNQIDACAAWYDELRAGRAGTVQ